MDVSASDPAAPGAVRDVKERPILFSGPMVRALLAGEKTQTRRVVRFDAEGAEMVRLGRWVPTASGPRCPYGAPGDRLWVRETFAHADRMLYLHDAPRPVKIREDLPSLKWRPSIHMPRWASRLTLDVIGVRVERLHDIGEADIRAEGTKIEPGWTCQNLRCAWACTWKGINGAGSWDANPWVWCVEFRRAA